MEQTFNPREWLDWLTRVRLVMIGLILLVGGVWPEYVPTSHISRYFLPIIILWITIGILQLILVRQLPTVAWLGPLQVSCDVVMITGVVYTTVLQDGNFTVLYLLVIIVASILFSRQGTRDASRSDHVFNFQDLTELRRLEQEVATKERKAAVGRLSAAKAREIRQPLAGAVRGLGRWCHVKKKQFVNLVSREPERLNHIIADFLNYSREKPYAFEEELPE